MKLAKRSVALFRKADDKLHLARAVNRRAVALYYLVQHDPIRLPAKRSRIVEDLGEALVLSTEARDEMTQQAALTTLAEVGVTAGSHADLKSVVARIQEAKRLMKPREGIWRCLPWLRLHWIQAKCFKKAGLDRHAERLLEGAYAGMSAVGACEALLVALDLAELYYVEAVDSDLDGEESLAAWRKLDTLSREVYETLQRHSGNTEELRAVARWAERIRRRALTLAALEELEKKLSRAKRSPAHLGP